MHKTYCYVNLSCEDANCFINLALSSEGLGFFGLFYLSVWLFLVKFGLQKKKYGNPVQASGDDTTKGVQKRVYRNRTE